MKYLFWSKTAQNKVEIFGWNIGFLIKCLKRTVISIKFIFKWYRRSLENFQDFDLIFGLKASQKNGHVWAKYWFSQNLSHTNIDQYKIYYEMLYQMIIFDKNQILPIFAPFVTQNPSKFWGSSGWIFGLVAKMSCLGHNKLKKILKNVEKFCTK